MIEIDQGTIPSKTGTPNGREELCREMGRSNEANW